MNILSAIDLSTIRPANPYTLQLSRALTELRRAPLAQGARALFWSVRWDVVHVQWPEGLFGWKTPGVNELDRLRRRLNAIKHRAAIVTTIHNEGPYPGLGTAGEALYELVYSATDAFVHLGQASVRSFTQKYREAEWCRRAIHRVIEHGDYSYYRGLGRDNATLAAARPDEATRLLTVFGAIRSVDEERLAREAFLAARPVSTSLVFAGLPLLAELPAGIVEQWTERDDPTIVRLHRRIPDRQVAPLIAASRFLLIPRAERLNSGVVPLACTFGVPVIGPDQGVIGELVRATGGFTYVPGDAHSAAEAISAAFALDDGAYEALRERVTQYCSVHMNWRSIAQQHLALYHELNTPYRRVSRYLRARMRR